VLPFLITYYGAGIDVGQPVDDPLRTVTTRDRFGLVTVIVDGVSYAIVDIGMRMLEAVPELLAAQFGKYARGYDMTPAKTKKAQTRLVGNSVCPEVEEALIAANFPELAARARARAAA
jgi:DNA (cytosine-5)-methyltransferase 1